MGFIAIKADAALPEAVEKSLGAAGIPATSVSVVAQKIDAASPAVVHNPGVARNPASVIKLVSTLAALDQLGPAYTWRSELLADAPIREGVLAGNLYLRGSGDPKLSYDRFWLLLRQLRDRGVREIRGNLLLDRSAFAPDGADPAAFDGKPLRPYNAQPDALLFNFNAITMQLRPNDARTAVSVSNQPTPDNFVLVNHLRLGRASTCGDWREQLSAVPQISKGITRVVLTGDYPEVCGEREWHIQAMRPDALLAGSFRALWHELGGRFSGEVMPGSTPETATPLAVSQGLTLAELVRDTNKFSNNVMARQIFLTLARESTLRNNTPLPATDAGAERAVREWLAARNIAMPQLVLGNGAGLSREARSSAEELAGLLRYAWQSPVMPEFMASLPIAALDGTMRKRLRDTPLAGRAHIKTGSLDEVKSLAGYVLDNQGQRWIVVFLVNHAQAAAAQEAMDALLLWVGNGGR